MKLTIKNLGPIKNNNQAIDLSKRLLVFTGQNGTGKTLVADIIKFIYTQGEQFVHSSFAKDLLDSNRVIDNKIIDKVLEAVSRYVESEHEQGTILSLSRAIPRWGDIYLRIPPTTTEEFLSTALYVAFRHSGLSVNNLPFGNGDFFREDMPSFEGGERAIFVADTLEEGNFSKGVLHPHKQIEAVDWIVDFLEKGKGYNRAIIITQSPFVLEAINNHIYIDRLRDFYSDPEIQEIIEKEELCFASPKNKLKRKDVGVYHFRDGEFFESSRGHYGIYFREMVETKNSMAKASRILTDYIYDKENED